MSQQYNSFPQILKEFKALVGLNMQLSLPRLLIHFVISIFVCFCCAPNNQYPSPPHLIKPIAIVNCQMFKESTSSQCLPYYVTSGALSKEKYKKKVEERGKKLVEIISGRISTSSFLFFVYLACLCICCCCCCCATAPKVLGFQKEIVIFLHFDDDYDYDDDNDHHQLR